MLRASHCSVLGCVQLRRHLMSNERIAYQAFAVAGTTEHTPVMKNEVAINARNSSTMCGLYATYL